MAGSEACIAKMARGGNGKRTDNSITKLYLYDFRAIKFFVWRVGVDDVVVVLVEILKVAGKINVDL